MGWSTTWQFSCIGPSGEDLCFNGGQCVTNETFQRCVCPEGFTGDTIWFHFPNCSRRTDASLIVLLIHSALTIITILVYMVKIHGYARNQAKRIGLTAVATTIAGWGFILSVYLQNGCFEGAAVTFFVHLSLNCVAAVDAIMLSLTPVYALYGKRVERQKKIAKIAVCVCILISFICTATMLGLTRRSDDGNVAYNAAAFVTTIWLWISGAMLLFAMAMAARVLKLQIADDFLQKAGKSAEIMADVRARLTALQYSSVMTIGLFTSLVVVTPVVISAFGSFPYFYVIGYIEVICVISAFVGGLLLFLMKRGLGVSSKRTQDETDRSHQNNISNLTRSKMETPAGSGPLVSLPYSGNLTSQNEYS